jgi:predicted phage terminase large subunit-like protein
VAVADVANPLISAAELAEAKRQIGPRAFAQEYEAQFLDREGAEFSNDYFGDDIWFDRWPDARDVRLRVMALDPSKGKGDRSDYSAFVMLAVDAAGVMWVEADLERRDVRRIIDDGMALARRFRPDAFGVEANQFQEVLKHIFEERSAALNFHLPMHAVHNHLNKETRIRATLTTHLARRDFRFKLGSRGTKLLVEQLETFPTAEYDDGPDALEMAVRLVRQIAAGEEEENVEERVTA